MHKATYHWIQFPFSLSKHKILQDGISSLSVHVSVYTSCSVPQGLHWNINVAIQIFSSYNVFVEQSSNWNHDMWRILVASSILNFINYNN